MIRFNLGSCTLLWSMFKSMTKEKNTEFIATHIGRMKPTTIAFIESGRICYLAVAAVSTLFVALFRDSANEFIFFVKIVSAISAVVLVALNYIIKESDRIARKEAQTQRTDYATRLREQEIESQHKLVQSRISLLSGLVDKSVKAFDEMAWLAASNVDKPTSDKTLEKIADVLCSAICSLIPQCPKVRASVYIYLKNPDKLKPISYIGRSDVPRTFYRDKPDDVEVFEYLEPHGRRVETELFPDTRVSAPMHYAGNSARYQTFIRTPIWFGTVMFGMLVIDSPTPHSLGESEMRLAELFAAELEPAFAIAAR